MELPFIQQLDYVKKINTVAMTKYLALLAVREGSLRTLRNGLRGSVRTAIRFLSPLPKTDHIPLPGLRHLKRKTNLPGCATVTASMNTCWPFRASVAFFAPPGIKTEGGIRRLALSGGCQSGAAPARGHAHPQYFTALFSF